MASSFRKIVKINVIQCKILNNFDYIRFSAMKIKVILLISQSLYCEFQTVLLAPLKSTIHLHNEGYTSYWRFSISCIFSTNGYKDMWQSRLSFSGTESIEAFFSFHLNYWDNYWSAVCWDRKIKRLSYINNIEK